MFNKENNIIVFANAHMGDFVWATSAISLIKQYNKNINITLITSKSFIDLIDKKDFKKIITTNPKYHLNKNKFIRLFYKLFWSIKKFKKFFN
jgi:ADP-heptose:LPS heptosyltransferase